VKIKPFICNTFWPMACIETAANVGCYMRDEQEEKAGCRESLLEQAELRALVKNVQRRSAPALQEVYGLVRRIAGPHYRSRVAPSDGEDRLHDAFLIVAEAVSTGALRDPVALPGFIRTVLRLQAVASLREVGRKRQEVDVAECGSLRDTRGDPEELLVRGEQRRVLVESIDRLPEKDRELLTRFYVDEQKRGQICIQMKLSATQFRLNKWRAKERLVETASRILAMPSRARSSA